MPTLSQSADAILALPTLSTPPAFSTSSTSSTFLAFLALLALLALLTLPGLLLVEGAHGAQESGTRADESEDSQLDVGLAARFEAEVAPFFSSYCLSCHDGESKKGKLDLSVYKAPASLTRDAARLGALLERLESGAMPPRKATLRPSDAERRGVVGWLRQARAREARRSAGDPGVVLAHRLSNAEYDHSIRDLTGVDIRPAREFPVDPANEEGFDNSGESLQMSPELVKKQLAAARLVAQQLVLGPHGLAFASHPAVTETDRDRYCVTRIVEFYQRHNVDYADYFLAAWRHRHREALGMPAATVKEVAASSGVSARYLAKVIEALTETDPDGGPMAAIRTMANALPAPAGDATAQAAGRPAGQDANRIEAERAARRGCEMMSKEVLRLRKELEVPGEKLQPMGISQGSQPLVLWQDRQRAASRRKSARAGSEADAESCKRFCDVFPDAFYIASRPGYFEPNGNASVRLLSAGFHLMQGYFRDDRPLYDLVLDDSERAELDGLWEELDFITLIPQRQYKDFIFFERAEPPRFMEGEEFDFVRSEDKEVTSAAMIERLREPYVERARKKGNPERAIEAMETYFTEISARIRRVEEARIAAEPVHLEALLRFAGRSYRRPLSGVEAEELLGFYRSLREAGLEHEDALRDTLTSVLLSPCFCFRVSLPAEESETAGGARPGAVVPLSTYSLASRLSYFLWSSLPDAELLEHAAAGDLARPEVLLAEARRMLRDPRVRGLATEFGGQWLDFRRFEEHQAVDRERFPSFTNELRLAMFEEPVRLLVDLFSQDRCVLDLLDSGRVFVNPLLASHYGMPAPVAPANGDTTSGQADGWTRVEDARPYGRGGLLPMAVFLTMNAPGLRTSPVKRGYWVVRRLLGEKIPPPPATVPELPADEAKTGDLTLRELLAKHREDESCAGCHDRFDAIGLAFEGFGPVGERRSVDLAGRPVDTRVAFPGGGEGNGVEGLRAYLRQERQGEYLDNLCRKLLAYALGRSLLLSDDPLVQEMRTELAANGFRFGALVDTIVVSPQFLTMRAAGQAAR